MSLIKGAAITVWPPQGLRRKEKQVRGVETRQEENSLQRKECICKSEVEKQGGVGEGKERFHDKGTCGDENGANNQSWGQEEWDEGSETILWSGEAPGT